MLRWGVLNFIPGYWGDRGLTKGDMVGCSLVDHLGENGQSMQDGTSSYSYSVCGPE